MQIHNMQVAVDQVRVHRLGVDVGGVLLAGPLQQGEVTGAHALLHPKLARRKVTNPPNAGAAADTDGSAT
eukprot:15457072-Alexandrium_andersonii.AAC.1